MASQMTVEDPNVSEVEAASEFEVIERCSFCSFFFSGRVFFNVFYPPYFCGLFFLIFTIFLFFVLFFLLFFSFFIFLQENKLWVQLRLPEASKLKWSARGAGRKESKL